MNASIDDTERQIELRRMQRLATGLLIGVTCLFLLALFLERTYPLVGFVRAFAEAAMVGAIADWFAVTALFRHPLGLPIPHTAIIPSRKDRIAVSIGRFVQDNFLAPEVVAGKLRTINVAERVAHWLAQPEISMRAARLVLAGVGGAVQVINDDDVQPLIERRVIGRIERTPAAPLVGRVLSAGLPERRRIDLLRLAVRLSTQLIDQNQDAIRAKISKEIPWWLPRSLDKTIYRRIFDAAQDTLHEVNADPNHPLHAKFNEVVGQLIEDLNTNPRLLERGEEYKAELLQHPIVRELSASLWRDLKRLLQDQSSRSDSELAISLQRAMIRFSSILHEDAALAAKINGWAERLVVFAVREYGPEFGQFISQTMSNWETASTVRKIELQIGRDLQFIRINGTLVGGSVGLLIYAVSLLIRG